MRFYRTTLLILAVCLALSACKKKEEAPPPAPAPAPEVSTAPATSDRRRPPSSPSRSTRSTSARPSGPTRRSPTRPPPSVRRTRSTPRWRREGTAPTVKLHAKWTFGDAGKVVKEEDLNIAPTGPAVNEFHISKKTGWPVGKYHVEISADGTSAGVKDFEVKK